MSDGPFGPAASGADPTGASGADPGGGSSGEDEDAATGDSSASDTEGAATGDDDGTGTGGAGVPDRMPPGLCDESPPVGSPEPPAAPAYSGGVCPAISSGYNVDFASQGRQREFAFVLPSDYDPAKTYPLVFGWYHLTGDAMEFIDTLDGPALADYTQSIIVVPQDTGDFDFVWPDTPLDLANADLDLGFFDDLYACIGEQYSVNRQCVSSFGVSAGGLWSSFLGQRRGQYLSSNLVFSGGYPTEFGAFWWPWQASPHRFASLVLWGGATDMLILNFDEASRNYLQRLRGDGHFVLECEHANGHGVPPIEPGDTGPFESVFHFIRNHPYWKGEDSILVSEGMPEIYPDYCKLP